MKKNTIKFLFILLIFFILIDLSLLIYFIKNSNNSRLIKLKNSIPFIQKEFITSNTDYLSAINGNVIVEKGDAKKSLFGTALFKGYVGGRVLFDKKTSLYLLPIKINVNNKSIKANLVFGFENHIINVQFVKNGVIGAVEKWSVFHPKDLIARLEINQPLLVQVFYQKNVSLFKKQKECDSSCKEMLDSFKQYSENMEKIINNKKEFEKNKNLYVGPTKLLIIYVK